MPEVKRTRVLSPLGVLELYAADGYLLRLRFLGHAAPDAAPTAGVLAAAAAQLRAYFAHELRTFALPLEARGSDFQRRVWRALCEVPFGGTISYGELARRIARPSAARAVGAALAANPLPILIPCHRVVAADGSIGGFSGPSGAKAWLLRHEGNCAR